MPATFSVMGFAYNGAMPAENRTAASTKIPRIQNALLLPDIEIAPFKIE